MSISSSFIWAAVTGGIGLGALACIAALGVVLFQSIPYGLQRLENKLLQLRKDDARRNPIEQLQNELMRRTHKLQSFGRALATVGGQIETISQMLEDRQRKDPQHVLERQAKSLDRLREFHAANLGRLQAAQRALEDFRTTIERKESEWTIAVAIGITTDILAPEAAEGLMQDLLTDTALRAVQDRFNAVFAELDVQMTGVGGPTRQLLVAKDRFASESLDVNAINLTRGAV